MPDNQQNNQLSQDNRHSQVPDVQDNSHHAEWEAKKHSTFSEKRSPPSSDEDDKSSRTSKKSEVKSEGQRSGRRSQAYSDKQGKRDSAGHSSRSGSYNADPHEQSGHSHVHFREKAGSLGQSKKSKDNSEHSQQHEVGDGQDDLARASWTTASFTEVPNAFDELTNQHYPSNSAKGNQQLPPPLTTVHEGMGMSMEQHASAVDLQSLMLKHGQDTNSILTKYLKPTMSDEGTQAGIPAWDWLTRLEQMLIHFFLMVFESSNDSSKLIMEMMSTEAGAQIEEIFQLLLKAEPDMYKELGHLVTLAEKWLIHWRGNSEEKQKALDYVRLYMRGVKDKNYYTLPVQVRLHKLGTFIAGLKTMGTSVPGTARSTTSLPPVRFPAYRMHAPAVTTQERVMSPRVKPATHFSQVVANILCGRPCDDPLPKADVYADQLGRNVFKNTLHGDKEFKTYTDKKYGDLYQKTELFSKFKPRLESFDIDGAAGDVTEPQCTDREQCIENLHCWIPKYTKSYVNNLEDTGCEKFAKADFEKSLLVKQCRLGIADEKTCKDIKSAKMHKKLYDWVRGPDGKVHRRVVGSYTELGTASSTSRLMDHDGGRGWKGKKGMRNGPGHDGGHGGGYAGRHRGEGRYPKAASDTKISRAKDQSDFSKNGPLRRTQGSNKDKRKYSVFNTKDMLVGKENKLKTYKANSVSIDGSGDSFAEEGRFKRSKSKDREGERGTERGAKSARSIKKGASTLNSGNKGGKSRLMQTGGARNTGGSIRTGESVSNAGNARSRTPSRQGRNGKGQDGRGSGKTGGSGSGKGRGRDSDKYKNRPGQGGRGDNKDVVNIMKNRNKQQGGRGRAQKSFKRGGHYTLKNEWDGEDLDWSPTGSDIYHFYHNEDGFRNKAHSQMLTVNECWEKASKLFKKPSKALVVPPAENLMLHLEQKYPKAKWAKGESANRRFYPNGNTFVEQFQNGASKVYYPHGGLAIAISAPSPRTSQILIVRDPSDHTFFFDKALIAELNSSGKGVIYGDDGVVKAQYGAIGGFRLDNLEKGQRWQWNQGGQRMLMNLNKFMSLRISDQDKIFLKFFGNHRGFLVNVASGHEVCLMNPESGSSSKIDPLLNELRNLIRPKTVEDNYDYSRGKIKSRPTLGFVDKAKHFASSDSMLPLRSQMSQGNLPSRDGSNNFFGSLPQQDRSTNLFGNITQQDSSNSFFGNSPSRDGNNNLFGNRPSQDGSNYFGNRTSQDGSNYFGNRTSQDGSNYFGNRLSQDESNYFGNFPTQDRSNNFFGSLSSQNRSSNNFFGGFTRNQSCVRGSVSYVDSFPDCNYPCATGKCLRSNCTLPPMCPVPPKCPPIPAICHCPVYNVTCQ